MITDTDFRPKATKDKEDEYISILLHTTELYDFACKILFLIIKHCKAIGLSKSSTLYTLSSYTTDKIIIKLGYTEEDATTIFSIISLKKFIEWNKERNITFLQLMSAFYKFQTNNEFVKKCIEYDTVLMKKFMNTVCMFFKLPLSISYSELKHQIIEKSYGQWFYLWVITFLQNSKINLMHHLADTDSDYVRKWEKSLDVGKKTNTSKYKVYTLTKQNVKYNQLEEYPEKTIVLGKTFMRPRLNGIWFNLMRKYKKEVIAGPSSSAILGYQILFDISKIIPKTEKNKVLVLFCMITDYSQYYHSMSEVLQTYVSEAELPPYTIDMNDLQYLKTLEDTYLKSTRF
jgi:hypothetical protein